MTEHEHTYNVTGTLPDGVFVTITVTAPNSTAAIAKAHDEEPDVKVTNVTRVLVAKE